jgi:signal transduction histidine kinase
MRLSLKISFFTALGILVVLSADGYLRAQQELARLRTDIARDHRSLGRMLAAAATVTAARAGAARARELLEDVNFRESGIDMRWEPSAHGRATGAATSIVSQVAKVPDEDDYELVTRIPLPLDEPGELVLRESLVNAQRYVSATIKSTLGTSVLLIALSSAIIFGVGWWLLGTPLRLLVARARQIGEGDLTSTLVLRQRDEMGLLANEMNSMSARLAAAHELADREAAGRLAALQQLRHADRLTTVGKLASGIAHELGTPLNVVDARAQMIARGESQGDDARQDAGIISEQTHRMARIIQQLLDFARPRRAQKAQHDLGAIVRTTADLLGHLATRRGITVRVERESEPVLAAVDASQMQQLVMNLLVNAIQAAKPGSEVRAAANIASEPPTDHWLLRAEHGRAVSVVVEDHGTGMTNEVRERMFEPFYTTKDVGQGTGLGLSVVYGIVEEHSGRIDVETEVGVGTRITVVLPAGPAND